MGFGSFELSGSFGCQLPRQVAITAESRAINTKSRNGTWEEKGIISYSKIFVHDINLTKKPKKGEEFGDCYISCYIFVLLEFATLISRLCAQDTYKILQITVF